MEFIRITKVAIDAEAEGRRTGASISGAVQRRRKGPCVPEKARFA